MNPNRTTVVKGDRYIPLYDMRCLKVGDFVVLTFWLVSEKEVDQFNKFILKEIWEIAS